MKIKKITYLAPVLAALLVFVGCVEAIDFEAKTYESALVIDARITNEEKQQTIFLSRAYRFEDEGPNPESSAIVRVISENNVYLFEETEPGTYVSNTSFRALPNVNYRLEIVTGEGRGYSSESTTLTESTSIDALYVERGVNDDSENGMSIYLDSYNPTGGSKYYRYEYEETYKIIAPKWVPEDLLVVDVNTCEVLLTTRSQEERVCYNTVTSTDINVITTNTLTEDRVSKQLIRFVNSNDYILSHRYSILVYQYVLSQGAYTYFKTLKDLSIDGSIFSQNQPGFFSGNVFSENDPLEKVIGFFEVSSVTSQRIYFNYEDYYPDEDLPRLDYNCSQGESQQYSDNGGCGALVTRLFLDRDVYHSGASIDSGGVTVGPFLTVDRRCGDCTALGSNVVPDFWID